MLFLLVTVALSQQYGYEDPNHTHDDHHDSFYFEPCSSNEDCQDYCNFDEGDHGFCETCESVHYDCFGADFHNPKGQESCQAVCHDPGHHPDQPMHQCFSNEQCEEFCNFDEGDHGYCESCEAIHYDCMRAGFSNPKGEMSCEVVCMEEDPCSYIPNSDVCRMMNMEGTPCVWEQHGRFVQEGECVTQAQPTSAPTEAVAAPRGRNSSTNPVVAVICILATFSAFFGFGLLLWYKKELIRMEAKRLFGYECLKPELEEAFPQYGGVDAEGSGVEHQTRL